MSFQKTLKALSDPIRRKILEMLKNERMSAGRISEHFNVTDAFVCVLAKRKNQENTKAFKPLNKFEMTL